MSLTILSVLCFAECCFIYKLKQVGELKHLCLYANFVGFDGQMYEWYLRSAWTDDTI